MGGFSTACIAEKIKDSSGIVLDIGSIADDQYLKRTGTEITGIDLADMAGGILGPVLVKSDSSDKIQYEKNGTGLQAAIAAASSGDKIFLGPQTYVGNFTIPAGVSLIGHSFARAVVLAPSDNNLNTVTLGDGSYMRNVTVATPTGTGKAGIFMNTSSVSIIDRVSIFGQGANSFGILNEQEANIRCDSVAVLGGVFDSVARLNHASGQFGAANFFVFGGTANIVFDFILGDVNVLGANISSANVTTGIKLSGNCTCILDAIRCYDLTTGLWVTSNDAKMESMGGFRCTNTVTNHVIVDSGLTTPKVHIIGGVLDRTKISYPSACTDVILQYLDEVEGDRGIVTEGENVTGRFTSPSESAFGGGDSHTIGMKILTNTNGEIGTWADVTEAAKSASGSTLTWPGITAGNAVYVGGDEPFPGIKIKVVAASVLGTGNLDFQYWNDNLSSWDPLPIMATQADYPYDQYGDTSTEQTGNQQERFGLMPDWGKKTLFSENKYFARGIITSDITSAAVIEQFKLHVDRFEINKGGYTEYFGKSRQIRPVPGVHRNLFEAIVGSTPSSEPLLASANISINAVTNEFRDNAIDSKGGVITVPQGIDTSLPFYVLVEWYSDATTGDIELELTHVLKQEGDLWDGSATDTTISEIITVPVTAKTSVFTLFNFPILNALPGNEIVLKLERDATGGNLDDTASGSAVIIAASAYAYFWRG